MPTKLVIIEETRSSQGIPFFTVSPDEALKIAQAMNREGVIAVVGDRRLSNNLQRIRTLFFPSMEFYSRWANSPEILAVTRDRKEYNKLHNIADREMVVDINYSQI